AAQTPSPSSAFANPSAATSPYPYSYPHPPALISTASFSTATGQPVGQNGFYHGADDNVKVHVPANSSPTQPTTAYQTTSVQQQHQHQQYLQQQYPQQHQQYQQQHTFNSFHQGDTQLQSYYIAPPPATVGTLNSPGPNKPGEPQLIPDAPLIKSINGQEYVDRIEPRSPQYTGDITLTSTALIMTDTIRHPTHIPSSYVHSLSPVPSPAAVKNSPQTSHSGASSHNNSPMPPVVMPGGTPSTSYMNNTLYHPPPPTTPQMQQQQHHHHHHHHHQAYPTTGVVQPWSSPDIHPSTTTIATPTTTASTPPQQYIQSYSMMGGENTTYPIIMAIDWGTTYSSMAYAYQQDGEVHEIST
ncbi:hypothetical protein BX616_007437, partial [Lobosporangium transversale]